MNRAIIYVHGKGGTAAETEHYKKFFPTHEVVGVDYTSELPWIASVQVGEVYDRLKETHDKTAIMYAGGDNLTSRQTVDEFVSSHDATLTLMENGEHWFHTAEQLVFLDKWMEHEKI